MIPVLSSLWRRCTRAVLVALCLVAAPPMAHAQVDPRGTVRTIATPHFRVHYRAPKSASDQGVSASLAQHAAALAEHAYAQMANELVAPRGVIDLLLADNVDFSNGFAQVFPSNRIVVYATPPIATAELRFHDDWLRLVITHELAHIFHLDRARGLWALGRNVFGRMPLFFPNALTPSWVKEGLAVHYESKLTGSGRVVSTESPLVARVAAQEQQLPSIDRWSLASSRYPRGQTAYAYGTLLMHRAALTGGDSAMRRYVETTARYPIPFLLGRASRVGFGQSFGALFDTMRDSLRSVSAATDTGADARWRVLSTAGFYAESPRWMGADSVMWSASNGREVTGLYVADASRTDGAAPRRVARRNAIDVNVPMADGRVLFAQWDLTDPYSVRSDLYVGEGDAERRLTHGARVTQPDVRRDGAIIAVQLQASASRLVRVAADGAITPLVRATSHIDTSHRDTTRRGMWAEPRWSPDGSRIAAVELLPTGEQRVVVLDTAGALQQVVTGGRAVFASPSFTPDGARLVWASDRSGRMQLETAPIAPGGAAVDTARWREPRNDVRMASQVSSALYQPSVSPDGRRVAAMLYRADGLHVAVASLDTLGPVARNSWYVPVATDSDTRTSGVVGLDTTRIGASGSYAAMRQLLPRYWLPIIGEGRLGQATYGVSSSSVDILGRHEWVADVAVNPTLREWDGSAAYRYAGLGVPVFDVSLSQEWDATFRIVDTTRRELGSIARRRRFATVSSTWSRPRVRSSLSGSVGAQYELRDFTATVDSLLGAPNALLRRGTRYPQLFASGSWSTLRRGALAIAYEEGVVVSTSTSYRWRTDDPSLGSWRSVTTGRAYVPLQLPGFTRHVLSVRGAVGLADEQSATEFSVGGVSGLAAELAPGVVVGDPARTFPVRGVVSGVQRGIRAVGGSVEYRLPAVQFRRAPSPLTLFVDRLSVALFTDAARAWCPAALASRSESVGVCERPGVRDGWIASAGAELVLDVALQYDQPYRFRVGGAAPYRAPSGVSRGGQVYVSLGSYF